MDIVEENIVYDSILHDAQDNISEAVVDNTIACSDMQEHTNDNHEKNSAVWTVNSVLTLLKLYETKLEMLETPKKKTRIWIAISDSLKDHGIEMSPDQVRWKINALTKRYKQCIDSGQHNKFKYFTQLNKIYAQYNVNCDSYYTLSELIHRKINTYENQGSSSECGMQPESKAMIELRKRRLANKIEADRCQSKVQLEKQWLEYLKRQEEQRLLKDEMHERNLKLREEEIELRKRELEIKESLELRQLLFKEKVQEEIIKLEREKCEMLKKIFSQRV
ncbi:uncharacterized protein [Epargyreus clarus]|uniref:uncharacterized protein n=1 Tax=Epargyreus clarus TaxID=520877 RepID=UPI003C3010E5